MTGTNGWFSGTSTKFISWKAIKVRRDALIHFARLLTTTTGTIAADEFDAIKAAGFSDRQLVEISLTIALIVFTNVFNRINDTVVDFPAVD